MSKINDGGPAFPAGAFEPQSAGVMCWQDGMTLRDYFAAKAMQGMMANPSIMANGKFHEANFKAAYFAADAMLRAREAT